MNRILSFFTCVIVGVSSFAQTQNSAYTAVGKGVATTFLTDYQCLGVNNSALGWGTGYDNTRFTIGTSELNMGIQSEALNKERLQNAYKAVMGQVRGNNNEPFDVQQQIDAAKDYAEAGIAINANYNWFGASFQTEKFGGIAVSVSENYNWYSRLNEQTSDLVFRGRLSNYFDSLTIAMNGDTSRIANNPNISEDTLNSVINGTASNPDLLSEITDGSRIKFVWNRYYNFGYGRKILGKDSTFALYAGVGGRYIQSMAMFDMQSDDTGINVNSAISPFFNINYGTGMNNNTNNGALPEAVGQGYGVDLSTSVILLDKIRLAASVNNIGSVTYTRNVYSVRDELIDTLSLAGLQDANIPESMNQLVEDGGLLNVVGEQEIIVNNAANFRLGGSINFNDKLHIGVDVVAPFNKDNPGSLQNSVLSVGGDVRPVKWLQLSAGYFGGGVYAHSIPVGVNFIIGGGKYEFGVSSRDMLSFFLDDANSLSAAFGFARFRF
jgi:hypothetical protein